MTLTPCEILDNEQFNEYCENKVWELEGKIFIHETIFDGNKNIIKRIFYNERNDSLDIFYRSFFDIKNPDDPFSDDSLRYEIYI